MMKKVVWVTQACIVLGLCLSGCTGPKETAPQQAQPENRELALRHFLEGSLLDQKGQFASAILEYQDALKFSKDPAIYVALAKDYAILEKRELAIEMGREAVRLAPTSKSYRETLAEIYLSALDLNSAIGEFDEIVRLDSLDKTAQLNLAKLVQVQQPERALELYRTVINRFGPDEDALLAMAHLESSLNRFDKASEALKGILALDPNNAEVKKALADSYARQDSIDAAIAIYNDLLTLDPDNIEVRAALAHSYLQRRDYTGAARQFELTMSKDSVSADNQLRFGQIFVSFIERDSAVAPYALQLFRQIRDAYPEDWRPYWFLGALYAVLRDDSGAVKNYEHVKELASWNPDGWIGLASFYYDRGQFESVVSTLNEALKYVPEEFRVHFLLGIAYQRMGKRVESATVLEKAISLNAKSVDALSALALVYDELKRPQDSDSIYEQALRLDPRNHLLLNNYAYSLSVRGLQLERALRLSKEALTQQPTNQSYLDTYGWIYYQLERYDEAERYIRQAITLGSKSAVIHEHLGDVYFKLHRHDQAMEYWRKALEADSSNSPLKEKIERGSL